MTSPSGSAVSDSRSIFALTFPSVSRSMRALNSVIDAVPAYAGDAGWCSGSSPTDQNLAKRLQDADVVGDRGASHVEHTRELGVLDLDAAGRAGELHRRQDMHGDAGGADRVSLGLEA